MIKRLSRHYPARTRVPIVSRVDLEIFAIRYFADCLQCGFCADRCCSFGVDIDVENVRRIEERADQIESYVGIDRAQWFAPGYREDAEFPGGRYTRARAVDGRCVFLNRKGRGCLLHSFSLDNGIDYHQLKPIVSSLFPVAFDEGLLHPSTEARTGELVCVGSGPTVYRGAREELLYYFGAELVAELDSIEAEAR